MTEEVLDATADVKGAFSVSYTPTTNGTYGVTAYWDGYKYYGLAFSDMHYINPTVPTGSQPTPTPQPTAEFPMEYVYVAIAVVVIVVVVAAVLLYMRGKK